MPIPIVRRIKSIDIYRDGGSIGASFYGFFGRSYTLVFPIHAKIEEAKLVKLGFKPPELEIYKTTKYTSPVTGKSYPDYTHKKTNISWLSARAILFLGSFSKKHLSKDEQNTYAVLMAISQKRGDYVRL